MLWELGAKSSCVTGSCGMTEGWIPTPKNHRDLLTGKGDTEVSSSLRKSSVSRYRRCACKCMSAFMYFLLKLLYSLAVEE